MVPVLNRPMLAHIIELLKKHDFKELTIMLHYLPDSITGYFGDGSAFGVKIKYLRPEGDLGTAGCVKFAQKHLDDTFLVISGDVLTDFDLTKAVAFHKSKKAVATMVLTREVNPLQYGVVIASNEGRIERFLEKPSWGEVFSDTINTGIYVLEPSVLDSMPADKPVDFSKDLFPSLLKENKDLYGYTAEGYWKDVGNLDEYRLSHYDVLDGKVKINIMGRKVMVNDNEIMVGTDTKIEDGVDLDSEVVIGKNCVIEKGAVIGHSVLGDNVKIRAGANIYGSVIWDNVQIGRDARLKESVIGTNTQIGDKVVVQVGTVIADNCKIGPEAVIKAYIKIWPEKTVQEGATLSTSLVWGEKWNRELFGAYGVTGLANIEVTPEFATKVGAAYGAYLGKGSYIVTSRDPHIASRMIKRTMISGLIAAGVKVGDLQTNPLPVTRYAIGKEGEKGGIHVRISPFDSRLMDIKFLDANGADIPISQEKSIEQLFLREDFKRASLDEMGDITVPARSQEYYRTGFLKTINSEVLKSASYKTIIDYSYSSASIVFPPILGQLGMDVVSLNAYINPQKITKTESGFRSSLEQLSDIVTTLKADAGFLIDNGAEKVFLIDERGRIVPDNLALILVADLVMRTHKEGVIAVPIHVSSVIEELARKTNIKVKRTPTSPRQIMAEARNKDVIFVGDCNGGFIFPEFQPAFDAMYAIAKILELMSTENIHLNRLSRDIPSFEVVHKKLPCSWDNKGQTMRHALNEAKGKKAELIDGVKIFLKNGWVLMLPDPDEPFFHIWAESEDEKTAKDILKEYSDKVKKWQE
jgi:mannose-1-phosphate guanylyltransferase/phosphomannomutase